MEQRDDRPTRSCSRTKTNHKYVVEDILLSSMRLKLARMWAFRLSPLLRPPSRSALAVSHETSYISALLISFRWDSRERFCLLRCELLSWSDQFRSHRLSSNPTENWKLYFCLQFSHSLRFGRRTKSSSYNLWCFNVRTHDERLSQSGGRMWSEQACVTLRSREDILIRTTVKHRTIEILSQLSLKTPFIIKSCPIKM